MTVSQLSTSCTNIVHQEEGFHPTLKWLFVFSVPKAVITFHDWQCLSSRSSLVALRVGEDKYSHQNAYHRVGEVLRPVRLLRMNPDTKPCVTCVCLPFPGSNLLPLLPRHKDVKRHFTAWLSDGGTSALFRPQIPCTHVHTDTHTVNEIEFTKF